HADTGRLRERPRTNISLPLRACLCQTCALSHGAFPRPRLGPVMLTPLTGDLRALAAVLERFLCPGGKLRFSPYVEAVQCSVLLGARPSPTQHAASLRELVGKPEHAARFDALAGRLVDSPSVSFDEAFFTQKERLDLYFAHYFPANLGKLQLVL